MNDGEAVEWVPIGEPIDLGPTPRVDLSDVPNDICVKVRRATSGTLDARCSFDYFVCPTPLRSR